MTAGDRILILIVVLAIVGLYGVGASKDQGERVMIRTVRDAQIYDMADYAIRKLQGPMGASEVEIGSAGIRMRTSTCRFQRCVHRGWVRQQGDMIVCIPNRIVVTILGASASFDAVSR